jgi:uncharacterized protein YcbX
MNELRLSAMYRYPLKSARGQSLAESTIDAFGLSGDRRWMLVDAQGKFFSQRRTPVLAVLEVLQGDETLSLRYGEQRMQVALPDVSAAGLEVEIWNDRVGAVLADSAASDWISARLGIEARLVYLPDEGQRRVDPAYALAEERVAFTDGFPLLVTSQASLDDLNARMDTSVSMDRFRPNLVIDGAEPFAEDLWKRLQIGETVIDLVKPCSRCVIPSIDQRNGQRDPLINRVLAGFRRRDGAIYFGMNALGREGARIAVGDEVAVLH